METAKIKRFARVVRRSPIEQVSAKLSGAGGKQRCPEPKIEELAGRVRFAVFLPEILPLTIEQSWKTESTRLGQVEAQVEAQVDLEILSTLMAAPKSSAEIAAALGRKQLSVNHRKALPRLRQGGLLEYTIPEKPNSHLQKYRLSAKGRALLTSGHNSNTEKPEGTCITKNIYFPLKSLSVYFSVLQPPIPRRFPAAR